MVSLFSKAESFIYVTSAIIVHENVQKKDGAPIHSYPPTNRRVPHTPDFLWSSVGSLNFMRLSLKRGAHAVLSRAAYRKFGASRSFFARCGIPQTFPSSLSRVPYILGIEHYELNASQNPNKIGERHSFASSSAAVFSFPDSRSGQCGHGRGTRFAFLMNLGEEPGDVHHVDRFRRQQRSSPAGTEQPVARHVSAGQAKVRGESRRDGTKHEYYSALHLDGSFG
jgi:hypothetical protein